MRLADSRKADISLSINAIVVIVIAFVVLGLALTLTRTIFSGALAKIPEALDLTQLESQPTAESPLSISDTINMKSGDSITLSMGYYNRWPNTASDVKIDIINCKRSGDTITYTPQVVSPTQIVPASEAKGYKLIIIAKEAVTGSAIAYTKIAFDDPIPSGTYICRVIAYEEGTTTAGLASEPHDPDIPANDFLV